MSSNAYKLDYDYPRKPHIGDFFKVGSKTQQKKKPQVIELHIEYNYDSAQNRTRAKYRARYFDTEMGRFISRDPLGYVDGASLYAGYFAQGFVMDPSGAKVMWLHAHGDTDANISWWQDYYFGQITQAVNEAMEYVSAISEDTFDEMVKCEKVKLNGELFTGSKSLYLSKIRREGWDSFYVAVTTDWDFVVSLMEALAADATEDYDQVIFSAHGVVSAVSGKHCIPAFGWTPSEEYVGDLPSSAEFISCSNTVASREASVEVTPAILNVTAFTGDEEECCYDTIDFIPTTAKEKLH